MKNLLLKYEQIPSFLKLLFFVEMWERFSYYGLRALLVLFLISYLNFTDEKAYTIYSLFAAISYLGPIIGGFIADKWLGFRNMVVLGSSIIILGYFFLILGTSNSEIVFFGLALIAVGSGLFKGNITNLLGCCYETEDSNREKGFTLFYVGINLGAFIASILCGYVAEFWGWEYGFSLAGVGMIIGLSVFMKFEYVIKKKETVNLMNKAFLEIRALWLVIIVSILMSFIIAQMFVRSELFVDILKYSGFIIIFIFMFIFFKTQVKKNLIALFIFTLFFMFFFALEMQLGSLINLFTERNISNVFLGFKIPTPVSQAITPLSIIIFGFLFGNYMTFSKERAVLKFAIGLFTMLICFLILYIGCIFHNGQGKLSYLYLIFSMCFIGIGELLVAPFIQSQATLLAPVNYRGVMMGIIMSGLAFANLGGIIIAKFMSIPSINGKIDCFQSLEIYKNGFIKIIKFSLIIITLFLLFYKFLKNITINQDKNS